MHTCHSSALWVCISTLSIEYLSSPSYHSLPCMCNYPLLCIIAFCAWYAHVMLLSALAATTIIYFSSSLFLTACSYLLCDSAFVYTAQPTETWYYNNTFLIWYFHKWSIIQYVNTVLALLLAYYVRLSELFDAKIWCTWEIACCYLYLFFNATLCCQLCSLVFLIIVFVCHHNYVYDSFGYCFGFIFIKGVFFLQLKWCDLLSDCFCA